MEEFDLEMLDEIGALVVVLDEAGRIVHWNEACTRLTGYTLEEARDEYVWELVLPPEQTPEIQEEFQRSKETETVSNFENYWVTQDGDKRWISWTNRPMKAPDGDSTYVVATGVDQTDAKRTEQELRHSRAKLRSILALAPDAVVVVDEDQEIVLFNDGAERVFGWEREEILGDSLDVLIPEDARDVHREHVRRFAEGDVQARRMGEASTEIRGRRRNGDTFLADAAISKVELDDEPLYTVILRDISERKTLEESLRNEIEQRDELMRHIVHDLRNPLNTISMRSQMLARNRSEFSDRDAESVSMIRESSEMMERLVDDLLEMASARAGDLTIRQAPTDLRATVDEVVSRYRHRAQEADIDLETHVPESLPAVEGDSVRLKQVFDNLIDNALKFTPASGEVGIHADDQGDRVVVRINDTGPGIGADEAEHIFEPFYQERDDDRRGAGLGLAIVQGIVESHGGEIRVESAPGEGTSFTFTLPTVG